MDEFGGIPVEEQDSDEFGGIAIAEPTVETQPPVTLSPYEKARLSGMEKVQGPFGPANPEEVLALGNALISPVKPLPTATGKGVLPALYNAIGKPLVEAAETPAMVLAGPALAASLPLRVAAGLGFAGMAGKSGLEKMQSPDPQTQLEGRMELAGAPLIPFLGGPERERVRIPETLRQPELPRIVPQISKEVPPAEAPGEAQPSAGPIGKTVETPVAAGATPQAVPEPKPAEPVQQAAIVTPPVTEPPLGPGAQTPGEPAYSAISQLSDRLKETPKVGLKESIPLKEKVADAWSEGKSTVDKSIGKMRAVTESLKETAKGVRTISELDRRVAEFDRAVQTSSGKSKDAGKAIERQMPNKAMRDAVGLWIDAGGDERLIANALANAPEGTKPSVLRAMKMATSLPSEAKQFAQDLKSFFSLREQDATQGELFERGLEDYYTHIWEKESNMPDDLRAAITNGKLSTYFQFARQRKIPQLLDGIVKGKTPILDPAKVIPFYNYAMDRSLASRKFIRDASETVEADGRPTLSPSGRSVPVQKGDTPDALIIKPKAKSEQNADYRQIDHPALRKWKWAGTAESGEPILYQSDLLVHPDAYNRLANMLDRGRLTPTRLGRALLQASTEVKGFKLGLLSAFHVVHVGTHAMWHWTNPFKALQLGKDIEWDSPRVQFAIQKGHLKLAPDPAELKVLSEGLMSGGLIHKIPLIGPVSRVWSEWTFGDFIPKLKIATFENAMKRNMDHYAKDIQAGNITPEQVASRVGDSVNNAFGELNHLFLGKFGRDPRFQRLLRGIFLAPDFGEARLRFVEKAFTKYGFEERLALLTMFTTMYVGARVANWVSHGDPEMDWKKAFSVKAGEHWYSMRSVIGDLDRAAADFGRFMYVRLNPLYSRTAADFLFGRDISGRKLTTGEKFGNIAKQLVPIQLGGLTRDDQKLWESFVTAMGVSTQRDRPEQDVHRFVSDWMKNNPDPKIQEKFARRESETFARSKYFPLRYALENEDYEKAKKEFSELSKTHNTAQITKAMQPEMKAVGGLNVGEFNRFLKSLNPEQRKLYDQSIANRKVLYSRYLKLIRGETK